MLYKFLKDGKQTNSAIAETKEEALKICNLKEGEYDSMATEEVKDLEVEAKVYGLKEGEYYMETGEGKVELKTRKPRADKGQSRKKIEKIKESPKEKSRKKPEYFLFFGNGLSEALTHTETINKLESYTNEVPEPRIIMGHEISFTRKVSLHMR